MINKFKKTKRLSSIFLVIISGYLLAYMGSVLFSAKLDVTSQKLYTLSEHTKKFLLKTDDHIRLKLYFSKKASNKASHEIRQYQNYFIYIVNLINEFSHHSKAKISLKILDPSKNSNTLQEALSLNLISYPISKDQDFFLGLVAENSNGDRHVIDFLPITRKDMLEYDLSKLIYINLNKEKKSIAVISPIHLVKKKPSAIVKKLIEMEGRTIKKTWLSFEKLEQIYDLDMIIGKEGKDLSKFDAVIIVHPYDVPKKILKRIDEYIFNGGRLLIFVDPHLLVDKDKTDNKRLSVSPGAGFNQLLINWGVYSFANTFAGDGSLSLLRNNSSDNEPFIMIPIMHCNELCTKDFDDIATSSIKNLTLAYPGVIQIASPDSTGLDLSYSPILSTTNQANTYRLQSTHEIFNPKLISDRFIAGNQKVYMGFKISGKFPRTFKEKQNVDDNTTDKINKINNNNQGIVIIYSDVDMISDAFAFESVSSDRPNQNINLLMSSVEALVGDLDLISIRSKQKINRSLTKINSFVKKSYLSQEKKISSLRQKLFDLRKKVDYLDADLEKTDQASEQIINEKIKLKTDINNIINQIKVLRSLNKHHLEKFKNNIRSINLFLMPILILMFGIIYLIIRYKKTYKKIK